MNGAMTDPLLSTTRPPKIAIITITGSIQNFLRTRRKAHNSRMNDIGAAASELLLHRFRAWARWLPQDPVTGGGFVTLQPQCVATDRSHGKSDWNHRHKEQQRHDAGVDHLIEKQTKPHPDAVQR